MVRVWKKHTGHFKKANTVIRMPQTDKTKYYEYEKQSFTLPWRVLPGILIHLDYYFAPVIQA